MTKTLLRSAKIIEKTNRKTFIQLFLGLLFRLVGRNVSSFLLFDLIICGSHLNDLNTLIGLTYCDYSTTMNKVSVGIRKTSTDKGFIGDKKDIMNIHG